MNYERISKKVLGTEEKIEFKFSLANRYLNFGLIVWSIIGLLLLLIFGLKIYIVSISILIILFALFYYRFYLKIANVYFFTNKRVIIHKGWLSTNTISIDYSKITDLNIREPFLAKVILHSGDMLINTAGTNLHEVVLNNIENPSEIKKKLDILKDKYL